jgi:hypothetical protein
LDQDDLDVINKKDQELSKETRRARSDRKKSVKETLTKIDDAKKAGKRRIDAIIDELKEEDVYDEVGEDEYQSLVRKRQAEGSFVEDDGGGLPLFLQSFLSRFIFSMLVCSFSRHYWLCG